MPPIDTKQLQSGLETPPEPITEGTPEMPPEPIQAETPIAGDDDVPRGRPTQMEDSKRNSIVDRFRNRRASGALEDDDATEIRRFANQGLPPEMAPEQQIEPEPPTRQVETPPAPRKLKLKVMGEERELGEEEVVALAQKAAAAENILDEAKARRDLIAAQSSDFEEKMRRMDAMLAAYEKAGRRPAQTDPNQDGQDWTQQDGTDVANQDDPYTVLAKDIVYGDPEEAGRKIHMTVTSEARRVAREEREADRKREEIARNQAFVASFKTAHPDIDEMAELAIASKMYEKQREDIERLAPKFNLKPEQIPRDQTTIANWHLHYRSNGEKVRSIEEMITKSYDEFHAWEESRGRKKDPDPPTEPEPAQPQAADKVRVAVDRNERRMQIPQQPTRTSVPREAQTAPPPRTRSQVVQNMIRVRSARRGVIGA